MTAVLAMGLVIDAMRKIASGFKRRPRFQILKAERLEVRQLAVPGDGYVDAGKFLAIDRILEDMVNTRQALDGEARLAPAQF